MDTISNKVTKALNGKLEFLGSGTIRGKLFGVATEHGYYPAYIKQSEGAYLIHGALYKTTENFTTADLDAMDEYEEYYKDDIQASEYIRETISVEVDSHDHTTEAMVYIYRRPITNNMVEIVNGNFTDFIQEHKLKTFHEGG